MARLKIVAVNPNKVLQTYADIMGEVRVRTDAVHAAANGQIPAIPSPFVREFCYLQIRMMCELIALGCLAAHGDLGEIKDLQNKTIRKEWSAHKIMAKLEGLHPKFFPVAIKRTTQSVGSHHLETIVDGVLSKENFLKLYHKCDGALHRGSLSKFISDRTPTQFQFPEIIDPMNRVVKTLSSHILVMQGEEKVLLCNMKSSKGGGVHVSLAVAPS
jgi:hypothetical protein